MYEKASPIGRKSSPLRATLSPVCTSAPGTAVIIVPRTLALGLALRIVRTVLKRGRRMNIGFAKELLANCRNLTNPYWMSANPETLSSRFELYSYVLNIPVVS